MNEIVPREEVSKEGVRAIGGLVGGTILLLLSFGGIFGIVGGAVLAAAGAGIAVSKQERLVGGILGGAGVLGILNGAFSGFGGGWLVLGSAGLIGYGAYSAYQFFRKLKTRT